MEWYFRSGLGLAIERGSDCTCSPVSIEDHPLLWMVFRSQTYYLKLILAYVSGKTRCSLVVGSGSFLDRLIGDRDGGGLSTTLSPGLRCGGLESKFESETQVWGLESKFGRGPGPHDRRVMGWSCLCLGYKRGMCFEVPSWAH